MLCIAICYGGKPVRRFVTGRSARLTYISLSKPKTENMSGVGFPVDAVFEFCEAAFAQMTDAWERGDSSKLEECKRALKPIRH